MTKKKSKPESVEVEAEATASSGEDGSPGGTVSIGPSDATSKPRKSKPRKSKPPKCIGCGSTKLYWVRPTVSRDQGSGKRIPKRLGCRICGDKWDVAA